MSSDRLSISSPTFVEREHGQEKPPWNATNPADIEKSTRSDGQGRPIYEQTTPQVVPDGGLRAWLVVLAVRSIIL